MKIASTVVHPLLIADPPLLNVLGVHQPYVPRAVIEVVTDAGVVGLGESYGDSATLASLHAVAESLAGADLFALNDLPRIVTRALRSEARRRQPDDGDDLEWRTRVATAAFEVAMLDAQGKTLGLPLHALLGGKVRDRVEFSAYLFYRWARYPGVSLPGDDWGEALDPAGIVRQARTMVDRYGFGSLKLKGGVFEPAIEIATIDALRAAFPDHPIRIDPNTGWSVETSIRAARELGDALEYLEDPTPGLAGMAEVAASTTLPLATNMCVTRFEHLPEAVERGSVRIVLSDHHYWGGLRATQQLAAICQTWGLSLSMHSNSHLGISLAAMTHLAAVLPDLRYACDTHWPWQVEDIVHETPFRFIDGGLLVSDEPGLGVTLDRGALATLHQRWLDSDVRDRDDGAAMRAVRPAWNPSLPRF